MPFRKPLIAAGALIAFTHAAAVQSARAQDWPNRPLTMVVPFAAGGPIDSLARILQNSISEKLGQPIIIENQSGGGGLTGSLRVSDRKSTRLNSSH